MANGKTVKRFLASLAFRFAEDPNNTFHLNVFFEVAGKEMGEDTATELGKFHATLIAMRDAALDFARTNNPKRDRAINAFADWLHGQCGMPHIMAINHVLRLIERQELAAPVAA